MDISEYGLFRKRVCTKELLFLLRCSRSKLSNLQKQSDFPKPYFLSKTHLQWDVEEVAKWLESTREPDNRIGKQS